MPVCWLTAPRVTSRVRTTAPTAAVRRGHRDPAPTGGCRPRGQDERRTPQVGRPRGRRPGPVSPTGSITAPPPTRPAARPHRGRTEPALPAAPVDPELHGQRPGPLRQRPTTTGSQPETIEMFTGAADPGQAWPRRSRPVRPAVAQCALSGGGGTRTGRRARRPGGEPPFEAGGVGVHAVHHLELLPVLFGHPVEIGLERCRQRLGDVGTVAERRLSATSAHFRRVPSASSRRSSGSPQQIRSGRAPGPWAAGRRSGGASGAPGRGRSQAAGSTAGARRHRAA